MTVGLIILFFKCSFVQLFQAEGAHEVFRMKLSEHGGDTTTWNIKNELFSNIYNLFVGKYISKSLNQHVLCTAQINQAT